MAGKNLAPQYLLPCLILVAFATPAFGQTWESASGKFKIEAEFVQLKDGKVQLKKESNDKLIWVDLEKLSQDAQKQARQLHKEVEKKMEKMAAASEPDKSDMLGQIELEYSAELKESDFNGEKPQVVVSVVATGPPAAEAIRYGKIKLAKFADGSGTKLTPEKDRFSIDDISKSLVKIDRDSMFGNHPDDGIAVEMKLPADVNPEMIAEFSGTFSILTGGERSVASIPNLSDFFGKTIKSDELNKAKLIIKVDKPTTENDGFNLSFNVSGKLKSLNRIWVGDGDQKELEEQQGNSHSSSGRQANFSFFFRDDVSDVAVLYVETVDGAVEVKVPFEFTDMEVQ